MKKKFVSVKISQELERFLLNAYDQQKDDPAGIPFKGEYMGQILEDSYQQSQTSVDEHQMNRQSEQLYYIIGFLSLLSILLLMLLIYTKRSVYS